MNGSSSGSTLRSQRLGAESISERQDQSVFLRSSSGQPSEHEPEMKSVPGEDSESASIVHVGGLQVVSAQGRLLRLDLSLGLHSLLGGLDFPLSAPIARLR